MCAGFGWLQVAARSWPEVSGFRLWKSGSFRFPAEIRNPRTPPSLCSALRKSTESCPAYARRRKGKAQTRATLSQRGSPDNGSQ